MQDVFILDLDYMPMAQQEPTTPLNGATLNVTLNSTQSMPLHFQEDVIVTCHYHACC
jgi:hypothetical protein